ncbi:hypothetical protein POTOM_053672 [Populus tomentosa]|uniref:Nodulin-like domain-containing protein n=1 Tax=Populus tomentosa TaxID=118781 RepID=A0A8X7XYF4_POPTO|nr:hypothetical protein POTOM_053672 [Populus tomentosa]
MQMCNLIFIGNNGETYINTAALVSCVQNFPKSRGPVVGILKGFAGLSGVILTQIYTMIHSPDHASLIFMVAAGPAMVVIALMFIVRPVGGHRQVRLSDGASFTFVYSVCLLLAAYLMGVMLLEDLVDLSRIVVVIFTIVLFVLLLIPIVIPLSLSFFLDPRGLAEEPLLPEPPKQEPGKSGQETPEADFWLIFFSLLLGSGSGSAVIDNLGQMCQSLGDHAYPRPVAMAIAQLVMAVGHVFFALGCPEAMYIGTLLIGLGYRAHWAIVPAAASEFIYDREAERQAHGNNYHIHNGGSFFSGMLGLNEPSKCEGSICYFLTSMIMSGFCVVAVVLSMILVHRTKIVYANLYGKSRS